ncbi:head maturation protease, ClpP-related [uncultured Clostridium sp.]|uniref:head maturation protease, ClpP-related n=1 Tax=uncultured Clostridium sp. TaxID=59620 RepID=UPI0028E3A352|nr:head maturation protease, ClpP-related [uncultured Clostridium sp.]
MKINIKGPIIPSSQQWIYDWFDIEATSPQKVNDLIEKANGEDLEIEINSGGGSVPAASEIYTALKSYTGNTVGRVVGLAASAASIIAMGVKKLLMSPTAQIMIHNCSTYTEGDYREMEHTADVLKIINDTIANAYRIKTGKTQEELLALMDKETWLTAQRAKELGFIDEIMFENESPWVANFNHSEMLPQEVINKVRNTVKNPNIQETTNEIDKVDKENQFKDQINSQIELAKAKLALEVEASYFNFREEF